MKRFLACLRWVPAALIAVTGSEMGLHKDTSSQVAPWQTREGERQCKKKRGFAERTARSTGMGLKPSVPTAALVIPHVFLLGLLLHAGNGAC